jgi:hypothetical protein
MLIYLEWNNQEYVEVNMNLRKYIDGEISREEAL